MKSGSGGNQNIWLWQVVETRGGVSRYRPVLSQRVKAVFLMGETRENLEQHGVFLHPASWWIRWGKQPSRARRWPRRATLFYSRQRVRIPVASTAINIVARCSGAQSNFWARYFNGS
ncbi:MAG: hypothetical protein CM1200mP29_10140 [Verrucomicrobiota bacterium]|nr:MAG: hypothetical protein CM1200mP29_10140 [Verrucomicrobiota bacterium]